MCVLPTLNKLVEEYTIVTTMKTPEPIIPSVNIMKTIEQVVTFKMYRIVQWMAILSIVNCLCYYRCSEKSQQ